MTVVCDNVVGSLRRQVKEWTDTNVFHQITDLKNKYKPEVEHIVIKLIRPQKGRCYKF
jgi:hypothetical protein